MEVIIKELNNFVQFEEIARLQKEIWHLDERDIISTITLKALTMQYPIMGLVLGAYSNEKMVGFVVCLPTREAQTLYGLIMGILPEFQNTEVGNKLGIKVLEKCLKQGVNKICWTYDPLESLHAHLYLNKWGAVVVKYEQNYYQLSDKQSNKVPMDRFIVDCSMVSNRVIERINQKVVPPSVLEAKKLYPVATADFMPTEKAVLVEIPSNFNQLLKSHLQQAIDYRLKTRKIFEEYINGRSYFITKMYSEEINGVRHSFYLLEKRSYL